MKRVFATLIALGTLGCVNRPILRDASLTALPTAAGDGLVRMDVSLELLNPNDAPFTVTSSRLELAETRDGKDVPLAKGRIDGTVVIPPSPRAADGTQALQTVRVPVSLLLDKASLESDAFVAVRSGRARIRGELVTSRGFPWPPVAVEINTPIPRLPEGQASSSATERFEPRVGAFKGISVGLTAEGKLSLRVQVAMENPSSKPVTLSGLELRISTPGTKVPLRLIVDSAISLAGAPSQDVEVLAHADLEECDPSLFDDIQANGRKAQVRFTGAFKTDVLDNMKFEERREITFKDRTDVDPEKVKVTLDQVDHTALVKLLKLNEWPMALVSNNLLLSAKGLLHGDATPIVMPIRNPVPGTIKLRVRDLRLLTPPKKGRDGKETAPQVVFSADSDDQMLPPRDKGTATIRVLIGPQAAKAALFYLQEVLPNAASRRGFTLEQDYLVELPLFGSVPIQTKTVYD